MFKHSQVLIKNKQANKPDRKGTTKPVPKVHNLATGEKKGAALSAVESKKMAKAIGVDNSVEKMRVIFQLNIYPIFHIVRAYGCLAPPAPDQSINQSIIIITTTYIKIVI